MVHIFSPDTREKYGLENLWKDAVELSVARLLAVAKAPKTAEPKSKVAATTLAKKRTKKK
jgi:ribosome-associated protein